MSTNDVIQQLLIWKSIQSLALFIPAIILCIIIAYYFFNEVRKASHEISGDFIGFLVFSFPCAIALACTQLTWLKIMVAPKLYLLEYVASLVK